MSQFLRRTINPTTPKLLILQSHQWLSLKFISTTSKETSFTVSYLTNTCGLSPERASFYTKYLNFETREKPDSVIEFFKNHGFSKTNVLHIVNKFPKLLLSDPKKTLQPKIDFFKSKGFSDSEIRSVIMRNPDILRRSLNKEIIPGFDFFNNMFESKSMFIKTIASYSGLLYDHDNRSIPNIKQLREAGVPESHILRFLEFYPYSLKTKPEHFKETLQEVKEMGICPLKFQFAVVVNIKIRISKSTCARKEGIYRKWGWTDDDMRAVFRVYPSCMAISDDKIEAAMDFLVNNLGFKSSAIARCPSVIAMSFRKRIVPRGSVIQLLLSKGLMKQPSLTSVYMCNEKVFLDKFILCHEKEADELLKMYQEAKLAIAS